MSNPSPETRRKAGRKERGGSRRSRGGVLRESNPPSDSEAVLEALIAVKRGIRRCLKDGRLGDAIEEALSRAGVTAERVRDWVGECGCEERKERLNSLGVWASRYLRGKTENMVSYLYSILGLPLEEPKGEADENR